MHRSNRHYSSRRGGSRGGRRHRRYGGAEERDETAGKPVAVDDDTAEIDLHYSIEERPPIILAILLGAQHYLTMLGATIIIPFVLAGPLGIDLSTAQGGEDLGALISTIFFMSGWSTLIQTLFGSRLPIVNGGSFSILASSLAILSTKEVAEDLNTWQERICVIQGAVIVGGIIEAILGLSGLIGLITRFLTPVTIAPTVALVGLALFGAVPGMIGGRFELPMLVVLIVVLLSQLLPRWSCTKESVVVKYLSMFPIVLALVLVWILAGILTAAGAPGYNGFIPAPDCADPTVMDEACNGDEPPQDTPASTGHTSFAAVDGAPWLRWPYPGQWGPITFYPFAIVAMLAGYAASIAESIGDYHAAARLSKAHVPNAKTISMGIFAEGIASIFDGLVGTGNGTTSYSENIGTLSITKVASRFVVVMGAFVMLLVGIIGKLGAVLASMPTAVVAGAWLVTFSLIVSVGLSNLQHVDLNSQRNLFIVGFCLFFPLMLQSYMTDDRKLNWEGAQGLATILNVIFTTPMAMALFSGLVLDNLIPGTDRERGKHAFKALYTGVIDYSHYKFLKKAITHPLWWLKLSFCDFVPSWHREILAEEEDGGEENAENDVNMA